MGRAPDSKREQNSSCSAVQRWWKSQRTIGKKARCCLGNVPKKLQMNRPLPNGRESTSKTTLNCPWRMISYYKSRMIVVESCLGLGVFVEALHQRQTEQRKDHIAFGSVTISKIIIGSCSMEKILLSDAEGEYSEGSQPIDHRPCQQTGPFIKRTFNRFMLMYERRHVFILIPLKRFAKLSTIDELKTMIEQIWEKITEWSLFPRWEHRQMTSFD